MEEAYTALYQEFLRLQLLCLKQAEMLQHLTEALRRQQGVAPVFNGDFEDLYSEPVRYRRDGLGTFTRAEDQAHAAHTHKQVAHTHTPAAQTPPPTLPPSGITGDSAVSPLAGALNRLHLEPVQEKVEVDGAAAASGWCETEERSILDELRQVQQRWYSSQTPKLQQQQQQRRPWSSSFLTSEMLSEAGGMVMSRITLHSQVCEFCHAVFPGHTTTRGDFLRHLTTHIS
ncbi:uncharacterized protein zgc:113184 isoform X1 [Ictalurus furcatus]|uniref:uncharacterized protein zgc:113184 isoform X1 n=1 Tax=Ictalurus furcatus TaxID=66913 RepID=UPI00234FE3CD|nr:uncharacterized protein zgc:113184 isoform X1 [Ictalurus furcatus]XP_053509001.1 uncharacterized protein zgc:113184 isoform X1 [Ictalurus furcatus]XP_053509002.1 uncharacterized protein zgc:113184 isoform X1 [Ictalurus furcatus]XP_053509003.1 uncharacterized protein zgc:113184 isoform X1 [Ictalurus furcatus]